MTVPGKGGRPRKWRSDADRVRAFRARERGEQEPPTLETALVDGDELALAVDRARRLQEELVDAIASLSELEEALAGERRRTDALRRRLERTQADLDHQLSAAMETIEQVRSLQSEVAEVRAANIQPAGTPADPDPTSAGTSPQPRRTAIGETRSEEPLIRLPGARNGTQRLCAPSG